MRLDRRRFLRTAALTSSSLVMLSLSKHTRALAQTAEDIDDPAAAQDAQALRVLLGKGAAQPSDQGSFVFEGRRYRGTFAALADGSVVNTVPLESYLYSVVSREMPASWPGAALQAQAILARTYVLQRSSPKREYDLVPSEADQVYTGIDAEKPQSNAAVDSTAGQVLRFGGGFAQIAYSSCCGGHTESNAAAWGGVPLAYLGGVVCPYCTQSPWYAWTRDVAFEDLSKSLGTRIAGVGDLQGVTLDPADASGRAPFWAFFGSAGTAQIKASDVRRSLGTHVLPSLLVRDVSRGSDLSQAPRSLHIEGAGLGHGVGLCQWGARGLALTGADCRAILDFYFPGTVLGND